MKEVTKEKTSKRKLTSTTKDDILLNIADVIL